MKLKFKIFVMLIYLLCGVCFSNASAEVLSYSGITYISEIKLIGKNYTSKEDPRDILRNEGYTVIDYNLNKGTGSGDDIFLGFKTTNYYPDAIKNIKILEGTKWRKNMDEEVVLGNGRKYKICPFAGDNHFVDLKGDLNSNAGGKDIHIFYTKEEDKNKTAISNITVDNNSSGSVDGINLNWKAKKTKIKIYLHTKSIKKGEVNMVKMTKPRYISDIKLVGQEKFDGAIPLLEKEGYKVINYDLNKNASGHYIYLGYKVSSDYQNAIKDLIIKSGEEYKDKNTIDVDGRKFTKCSLAGDDRFVNSNKGDLNTKSSGDWLFLYYTKEENKSKNAICKLTINNESKGAISEKNLNEKAGGDDIYLHVNKLDYMGRAYINEINPSNWMSYILDDVKITDLNLPGAHDAATVETSLIAFQGSAECQSYHIGKQTYEDTFAVKNKKSKTEDGLLQHGVRYLDIRYGYKDSNLKENEVSKVKFASDHLRIVHGGYTARTLVEDNGIKKTYTDTTNDTLMKWIKEFLDENPDETVIMYMMTDDNTWEKNCDAENYAVQFFKNQVLEKNSDYPEIYFGNHVPTLGEARGKLVVLTNFASSTYLYKDNLLYYWGFKMPGGTGDEENKTLEKVLGTYNTRHSVYIDNKCNELSKSKLPGISKITTKIKNEMINEKWMWIANGLRDAKKCRDQGKYDRLDAFILIYTSANELSLETLNVVNNPKFFAKNMNPKVSQYINNHKQDFLGIIIMDYVDDPEIDKDVSYTIWSSNFYRGL